MIIVFLFSLFCYGSLFGQSELSSVPVAYNGRIRPFEVVCKLCDLEESTAFHDMKILPLQDGEWVTAKTLQEKMYDQNTKSWVPIFNFTSYPDDIFERIRDSYLNLLHSPARNNELSQELAKHLVEGYFTIQNTPQIDLESKTIYYPSLARIKAELFYFRYPIIYFIAAASILSTFLILIGKYKRKNLLINTGLLFFGFSFILHTIFLGVRIYILGRPPVSNMYETVIYVPWIASNLSIALYYFSKNENLIVSSSLVCAILLTILQLTKLNTSFEVLMPVLDSQYWLIVHVLLVVGSYGAFALSCILAHISLIKEKFISHERNKNLIKCIVTSMYIGVAMLISGTLLGGVWAAQSWGRFWDWDPKESWAFISACIYLIWIHAYRFKKIGDYGITVGAILGFVAISFTWYGVNYILGTGLHSYGFGSGGEVYYYIYILGEIVFLVLTRVKVTVS